MKRSFLSLLLLGLGVILIAQGAFFKVEEIFPLVDRHVHAPSILELPNGDLLACWFEGSGERKADDVAIMGARKLKGAEKWSEPFVMADTPGFPDINPVMFIDTQGRLWLMWYTVLTNLWESSLLKYRYSYNYMMEEGPPEWAWQDVLHVRFDNLSEGIKENDTFAKTLETKLKPFIDRFLKEYKTLPGYTEEETKKLAGAFVQDILDKVWGRKACLKEGYPLLQRIGWQTGNRPLIVGRNRLLVPLYSDGLEISIIAISEDWGKTWTFSEPIVGIANIQPALFLKSDGTLVAYMRNNSPYPRYLYVSESKDGGITWSEVEYTDIPNPGSRADGIVLNNGHWLLVCNDTMDGRYRLTVMISDDEGKTWKWKRSIESYEKDENIKVAYPSVYQGKNGLIHVVYSYHSPQGKTIKHAVFNEEWVMEGE